MKQGNNMEENNQVSADESVINFYYVIVGVLLLIEAVYVIATH